MTGELVKANQSTLFFITLVSCPAAENKFFIVSSRTFFHTRNIRTLPYNENMNLMNSLTNKKHRGLEIAIHLICWGLFFAFPLFMIQQPNGNINWTAFLHHCVMPSTLCIIFYLNYFLFIPHLLFKERDKEFFTINLIAILLLIIGTNYYSSICFPPRMDHKQLPPRIIFILRDMISLAFSAGLSVSIRMSIRLSQAEAEKQEAVKSRTEAELKNLRNQLNPHFLLNTLNNIYALVAFDTDKAQQAIQELSKLLRYVLYDNQQMYVPLTKEADFIKNYIELMRIRVSPHVKISTRFDIKPQSQTPIAPLIFISLIENAFKHGISPVEDSFIDIILTENDGLVTCNIRNSNHPKNEADKSGSGIGLEQVSKRLELIYPNQFEWKRGLTDDNKTYQSILTIHIKNINH